MGHQIMSTEKQNLEEQKIHKNSGTNMLEAESQNNQGIDSKTNDLYYRKGSPEESRGNVRLQSTSDSTTNATLTAASQELKVLKESENILSDLIQKNLPYGYDQFQDRENSLLIFHLESTQYRSLLEERKRI